jgi:hypothetical protein
VLQRGANSAGEPASDIPCRVFDGITGNYIQYEVFPTP